MSQSLAIFDPNNRFFYDDLLDLCIGSHTRKEVNQAISASVAFTTTKSGMWVVNYTYQLELDGFGPNAIKSLN